MRLVHHLILSSVMVMAPAARAAVSEGAARGVLQRLLPDHVRHFDFQSIPQEGGRDVFELESQGERIILRGTSANAMC